MAKKWHTCPYLGIRVLPQLSHFGANWAETYYGSSEYYFLSINDDKFKFIFIFLFFGIPLAGKWMWPPRAPLMV